MLSHYAILIGVGLILGTFVFARMIRSMGLDVSQYLVGNLVVGASGVLGAVLWNYLENPSGALPKGLRYPGAAIAILGALLMLRDRRFGG